MFKDELSVNNGGRMLISLDFELLCGNLTNKESKEVRTEMLGARSVIPKLLKLFNKYNIHVTWAIVGMLFSNNIEETKRYIPNNVPTYKNIWCSNYSYLDSIGKDEEHDPYYYAESIIKKIEGTENQEIGTHTFSHYFCLEDGQTQLQFESDLESAVEITQNKTNKEVKSIVFPRNQINKNYVETLKKNGITSYRGCEKNLIYHWPTTTWKRALRLVDTYFNITGYKCYSKSELEQNGICNLKASRFFRGYCEKLKLIEHIKISRIKGQMKYAAKNGKVFHIWWHPHNMGNNQSANLNQLEELLKYYVTLKNKYGFSSLTMNEMSKEILDDNK